MSYIVFDFLQHAAHAHNSPAFTNGDDPPPPSEKNKGYANDT